MWALVVCGIKLEDTIIASSCVLRSLLFLRPHVPDPLLLHVQMLHKVSSTRKPVAKKQVTMKYAYSLRLLRDNEICLFIEIIAPFFFIGCLKPIQIELK